MKRITIALALLLSLASAVTAAENRFVQFNTEVEKAYGKYRVALFQTNKDDMEKSSKANKAFINMWIQIRDSFADNPPDVYGTDPMWSQTIDKVLQIAEKSGEQIAASEFAEAHETLEEIRDQLSELRARNSVIVFSDHINNYHEVMEGLVTMPLSPKSITSEQIVVLGQKLAVLQYLAVAIEENAPDRIKTQEKYQALEKGLFQSIADVKAALKKGEAEQIKKSVKMLKPAYAKLFVNFG